MWIQTILIMVIAFIANAESFLGYGQFGRPIISGVVVGWALGDVQTGLMVGATLELAFIGNFAIGGALPPDIYTGGILAAAFAIRTGSGVEGALALALPIATLALLLKNVVYIFGRGYFVHKADTYALAGNDKKVARMHVYANLIYTIPIAILTGLAFHYGGDAVEVILAAIPNFIMKGLTVASGILPALGFAMLARMIMNKKVAPYFFLGFAITAYLNIPVLGIAIFAIIISILVVNSNKIEAVAVEGDVDLDEEF